MADPDPPWSFDDDIEELRRKVQAGSDDALRTLRQLADAVGPDGDPDEMAATRERIGGVLRGIDPASPSDMAAVRVLTEQLRAMRLGSDGRWRTPGMVVAVPPGVTFTPTARQIIDQADAEVAEQADREAAEHASMVREDLLDAHERATGARLSDPADQDERERDAALAAARFALEERRRNVATTRRRRDKLGRRHYATARSRARYARSNVLFLFAALAGLISVAVGTPATGWPVLIVGVLGTLYTFACATSAARRLPTQAHVIARASDRYSEELNQMIIAESEYVLAGGDPHEIPVDPPAPAPAPETTPARSRRRRPRL